MREDKKQMILNYIKSHNLVSTTRIADHIKSNHDQTLDYLNELEEEGKISSSKPIQITNLWSLRSYKKLPKNQTMKQIKGEIRDDKKQTKTRK